MSRGSTLCWLFLKALGLIYGIAFVSLAVQLRGLIGAHGILPAARYLAQLREQFGASCFHLAPTIFWLASSDAALLAACVLGIVCAALVILGVCWRPALFGAFVIYLSFASSAQEFLSYQWDFLLLESGFLALFLGTSPIVVWLFRWLLFRLMFFSGAVKLLSGDESWRHLTAMMFHYQTQPLPTPLAWYAHQLPSWVQKGSTLAVFLIELPVALLALGPLRARLVGTCAFLILQVLIILTGNYAFFNLLAIALCLFLLSDEWLALKLPPRWRQRLPALEAARLAPGARRAIAASLAGLIGLLSGLLSYSTFSGRLPEAAEKIVAAAAPFGIVNTYGLFAIMTTTRPEIIVEGSRDGAEWREYEFAYKPGNLSRPPPWVAPHQPRLDWQMWFAALGSARQNAWFLGFISRLLEGRSEVLALLERNPFPEGPPQWIRATVYEYRFTHWNSNGQWWTRQRLGAYTPPLSLKDLPQWQRRPGF